MGRVVKHRQFVASNRRLSRAFSPLVLLVAVYQGLRGVPLQPWQLYFGPLVLKAKCEKCENHFECEGKICTYRLEHRCGYKIALSAKAFEIPLGWCIFLVAHFHVPPKNARLLIQTSLNFCLSFTMLSPLVK